MSDLGGDPPCWAHLVEELSESGGAPDPGWFADLGAVSGSGGAVWSLPHGGDLNANLVRLDASGRIGEHINDDVDVLLFVQSGGGELGVGDRRQHLAENHLVLIPRGAPRQLIAGPDGITYLSVHRRRGPLDVRARSTSSRATTQ